MTEVNLDHDGIAFTLCREGHLHTAMKVESRSTIEQFLALANGLECQLATEPEDVLEVHIVMPLLYTREQVAAIIVELREKATDCRIREIKAAQEGFPFD